MLRPTGRRNAQERVVAGVKDTGYTDSSWPLEGAGSGGVSKHLPWQQPRFTGIKRRGIVGCSNESKLQKRAG